MIGVFLQSKSFGAGLVVLKLSFAEWRQDCGMRGQEGGKTVMAGRGTRVFKEGKMMNLCQLLET